MFDYVGKITRYKRITPEEEISLAKQIRQGGAKAEKAVNIFLCANLRLVLYQVGKIKDISEDQFNDLVQEGNIGLLMAIHKFDPKFKCRFSTYALWWIRQRISRSFESDRTVKIPTYRIEINKQIQQAYAELKDNPNPFEEIREYFGVTDNDIYLALHPPNCSSLETPIGEENTLGDVLSSDERSIEEEAISTQIEEKVLEMVSQMDKEKQKIIKLRFGLQNQDPSSYQKIGDHLGLSRSQVCKIISDCICHLKKEGRGLM